MMMRSLSRLVVGVALGVGALIGMSATQAADGPSKVVLEKSGDEWQLVRNGAPYFIKGAGGKQHLEDLVAAGGNSIRTWGADNIDEIMADAERLGLTVTIGFWLGHERHGFNYDDEAAIAKQLESCRKAILKYRNHPSLLMWAAGNEMEADGSNEKIFKAVNDVAKLCKELDPNHPVMTVVAEVGGPKVANIHKLCPDIDIVGINSYGGVGSIGKRYREAGGTKPYVVTEFGPPGQWEVGELPWGAPPEMTSTEKAAFYAKGYREGIAGEPGFCLGSYVFLWGFKQEATATWYGIYLKDDSRTQVVEAMAECWGGKAPANLAPRIGKIALSKDRGLKLGDTVTASVDGTDPEGDALRYEWVLRRESGNYATGGDDQPDQVEFADSIKANGGKVTVTIPGGGPYRLFCYLYDGKGNAAVANVPLKAEGQELPPKTQRLKVPFTLYGDSQKDMPWIPSGYMGNGAALNLDPNSTEQPAVGKTCLQVEYTEATNWAGVVWQSPANDWGEKPGGFDLSNANVLSFRARGQRDGIKANFGVGIIGKDKPFSDSVNASLKDVTLTTTWQTFRIPLSNRDLTRVKSGFYFSIHSQGPSVTFYLDEIVFEHDNTMPDALAADPAARAGNPKPNLPFALYADGMGEAPWVPSGYMGNAGAIAMEPAAKTNPHSGSTCLKVDYKAGDNWAGVVWQSPANDWGDLAGGYDLTGSTALEFWVRGETGGEKVTFGYGIIGGNEKPFTDSSKSEIKDMAITSEWQRVRIPLDGKDLSQIKSGFYWVVGGQGKPLSFYLDDIRYVADAP